MRKNIAHIAVILALGALAVSCNKFEDKTLGDDLISFEPQAAGTKAIINDETGLQTQTFAVKDIVGEELYVDNTIQYNGGWAYTAPADAKYLWKNGTHNLFGYTAGMGTFAGTTLTLPATTLTASSAQNDLLYSDIVTTTAEAWKAAEGHKKGTPVPLHFHHLLSAISLTLENYTGKDMTVNSVTVTAPNKSTGMTIGFADAATASVTPGTLATDGTFGSFVPGAVASNVIYDVFGGVVLAEDAKPVAHMIWPQTLAADAATITISFTVDGTTKNVPISIPAGTEWNAGEVNAYNIQVYPDKYELEFKIAPWVKVASTIDSPTESINMSNVNWMNSVVKLTPEGEEMNTRSNYYVHMYYNPYVKNNEGEFVQYTDGYLPAQAFFTVNYPASGLYKIGLIQALYWNEPVPEGMYEIYIYDSTTKTWKPQATGEDGEPTGQAITHDTIYFQVRATSNVPETHPEYRARVDVWFKPEGSDDWISALSEVRATNACVIPATN